MSPVPGRLKSAKKTVGAKQTIKALEKGTAVVVYVAKDAEDSVTRPIQEMCASKGIELVVVESMQQLGKACGIQVGASTAAVVG